MARARTLRRHGALWKPRSAVQEVLASKPLVAVGLTHGATPEALPGTLLSPPAVSFTGSSFFAPGPNYLAGPAGIRGGMQFDGVDDLVTIDYTNRLNQIENPSFEYGLATITSILSATLTQSGAESFFGTKSLKIDTPGVSNQEGVRFDSVAGGTFVLVDGLATYSFSAYVKGVAGATWRLALQEFDASNANLGTIVGATETLTGAWQRIQMTMTTQATTAKLRAFLRTNLAGGLATTLYADGVLLEKSPIVRPWFSGDSDIDTAWEGTPGGSPSTKGFWSNTARRTFECWLYLDDAAAQYPILVASTGVSTFVFDVFANDMIAVTRKTTDNEYSGAYPSRGAWVHLDLGMTSSGPVLKVNGVTKTPGVAAWQDALTDSTLSTGKLYLGSSAFTKLKGRMALAAFYNKLLTNEENARHRAAALRG